jgi:flagellar hook-associated protein FlgK
MLNIMDFASSALMAYAKAMNTTAGNVANINTDGYMPKQTRFLENKGGGVEALTVDNSVRNRQDMYVSGRNSVNYVEEATEQIIYLRAFQANAGVVRTADETLGTLINITA